MKNENDKKNLQLFDDIFIAVMNDDLVNSFETFGHYRVHLAKLVANNKRKCIELLEKEIN
jgi:hypothetical protein